ncbi:MAG TPA: ferredoxin [Bacteroidales bacterium]|nr:MAG: ferredoxin [Bacteroidetes bacterium GWF2_33_38]HBF88536.1 ferredoxin [Bacteroidales bacterium]
MDSTILYTIISLTAIGVVSAMILYVVAQKFKVIEDPRIDDAANSLPGANCGGCGYPGCRGFAEACVKAETFDDLFCPVGGNETMKIVAKAIGKEAVEKAPMIAVVRCSGTYENRQKLNIYDGAVSCAISSALYSGDTGCKNGCLGLGDCVSVCKFDAIFIDKKTGLPVVDEEKCTACGACVKACPKLVIELRKKGPKSKRIFVSCINTDKGALAKKSCSVACIACKACLKACPHDAIVVENLIAYIDFEKCKLCRKCVDVCPTGSILELNFPPKKEKPADENAQKNDISSETNAGVAATIEKKE